MSVGREETRRTTEPLAPADRRSCTAGLRAWVEEARKRGGYTETEALAAEIEPILEELEEAERDVHARADELATALGDAEGERRLYHELFDHGPLPYVTTDPRGVIVRANQAAARLLGVDRARLEGARLTGWLADPDRLRSRLEGLGAGEPITAWEAEVRPRDDAPVPVEVSARRVERPDVPVPEILWVIRDVRAEHEGRERKQQLHRALAARAALEQVALRARFLSSASARLMAVHDPAEVWRAAAELAAEHATLALAVEALDDRSVRVHAVGGEEEARRPLVPLLGRTLELQGAAPESVPLAALRTALGAGESEVIPPSDAADPPGARIVIPVRPSGLPQGALAIWLDPEARIGEELLVARSLAERVAVALESAAMFQELIRARRRAEEASAAEADFLSIVSHELRTPLTAIISYAELLEDRADELPERLGHYARQIGAAADHQRQLVQQVLAYERVQRGEDAVVSEELDFRKAARSAVAMVRPQVRGGAVDLEAVLPEAPVRGVSDVAKVQQILTNLLSNAVRHTERGHVRLIVSTEEPWVVFRVEDTGEGIPPGELSRIFDRFWRGGGSDRDRGGSGLGLTITRELVSRLGGEIAVESERGAGTTFTVRIPRISRLGPSRDGR